MLAVGSIALTGCTEEANAALVNALTTESSDGKPRKPSGMREVQMPLDDGRLVTCITWESAAPASGMDCDFNGTETWEKTESVSTSPATKTAQPAPK